MACLKIVRLKNTFKPQYNCIGLAPQVSDSLPHQQNDFHCARTFLHMLLMSHGVMSGHWPCVNLEGQRLMSQPRMIHVSQELMLLAHERLHWFYILDYTGKGHLRSKSLSTFHIVADIYWILANKLSKDLAASLRLWIASMTLNWTSIVNDLVKSKKKSDIRKQPAKVLKI